MINTDTTLIILMALEREKERGRERLSIDLVGGVYTDIVLISLPQMMKRTEKEGKVDGKRQLTIIFVVVKAIIP